MAGVVLTGAQASYFWQGLATAMPTPTNTAPDAVVIAYQTDTHTWWLFNGTTWVQMQGAPNIRLNSDYVLQYSLDGGATWVDITGWDTYSAGFVASLTPRIQMQSAYSFPPIPEWNAEGTDYVYVPTFPA